MSSRPTRLPSDGGQPGVDHPDGVPILDVTAVDELAGIRHLPNRVDIGALVTWTEAIESDLPPWFDCVRLAAREVGGHQIQNRATIAGNLCNASPAADGVPAFLVLNARVRLRHLGGTREIPLREFITGNRRTSLQTNELMTAIIIPSPTSGARSTFLKLGARRYLVISIAMAGACLELRDGRVHDARLSVGACSEVALRLKALEARLEGVPATDAPDMVREEDFSLLSPLSDVRASAQYRRQSARVLVRRALCALTRGEPGSAGQR